MRRAIGYVVISISVALLITGITFFVGEGVVAPVPGVAGSGGSATVSGFPVPYATEFCCGSVNGISLNNTYYYHPLNFVADFALWCLISLAAIFTFTFRRFALAAVAGLVVTLLTLLLPPLSIVRPSPGMETSVLTPMGFPYEYLTYYVVGLPGVANPSGYEFALSPALADYALWTGVAAALVGITFNILRGRKAKQLNSEQRLSQRSPS
jgi:hypothetical protein